MFKEPQITFVDLVGSIDCLLTVNSSCIDEYHCNMFIFFLLLLWNRSVIYSQSTVDLIELIFNVLQDATVVVLSSFNFQKLCGRLTLTVRNVLQLFTLTASRHHGTAISSMPNMAAIFYNNCYYICHRLMLMPFSLLKNYTNFRPILSDSLWKIREIGADVLEQVNAGIHWCCFIYLSTFLDNGASNLIGYDNLILVFIALFTVFGGIDDLERYDAAKNVLNACLMHIQNVFPEMVYSCTLGNIVSFLLDSIGDVILRTEDIRSVDADISSTMIETLLTELIKGQSSIHKSCATAYFRMKEIIFCSLLNYLENNFSHISCSEFIFWWLKELLIVTMLCCCYSCHSMESGLLYFEFS
ncbi:unnamed protein product [Angiostrongylus costaricensis]|uniref:MMS22L_N domain-containing protein n=1 Tax=Angiostrongylus costaricensis TaxID=334426 RepID=A0A0R3PNB5_ANGCS|nr:unnamed protein product [Angiostrongylus costaricensis]